MCLIFAASGHLVNSVYKLCLFWQLKTSLGCCWWLLSGLVSWPRRMKPQLYLKEVITQLQLCTQQRRTQRQSTTPQQHRTRPLHTSRLRSTIRRQPTPRRHRSKFVSKLVLFQFCPIPLVFVMFIIGTIRLLLTQRLHRTLLPPTPHQSKSLFLWIRLLVALIQKLNLLCFLQVLFGPSLYDSSTVHDHHIRGT